MILLDGKAYSKELRLEIKENAERFYKEYGRQVGLAVVIIGEDPASKIYVNNKIKGAEAVGINSIHVCLSEDITQEQYIEQLKINTTTKIAKIPTLQGVSINKADIYWERFLNKKTKEECYDYYILYPFSSFELQELIDAFNAQEKAMNEKIESYRENLDDIDEINVLLESINEMKSLMKQVGEYDPVKSDKLKNYISLYEKVISEIFIEVLENGNGVLLLQLKHDEKVMKTTSLPQVRCDCVKDIKKKHIGNHVKITFDTFDCYFDQDDIYMTVTFNFGKKKVSKKLIIKK